jgi:hypothetical protein
MIAHRWWHGCTLGVRDNGDRGISRGVFALVFIRSSFAKLPIAHKTLSRRGMALVVGVKALEQVVAAAEELAQSPQVIEPGEVGTNLVTCVLLGVDI